MFNALKFKIMKSTKILSGNFAKGEGTKGNFSGYNASGERIFVHANQMAQLGITSDAEFKPFFAIVGERTFSVLDADGKETDETFTRKQALSVFATQQDLVEARNADAILDLEATKALKTAATTAGLTDKEVEALMSVAL